MDNEMLVSVIVPVYNVKPYLAEALDSILCQTYERLEIIVVDDGSTDGSDRICNDYAAKDKRIKVIHQKNRGLSSARNAGLDNANGQIISFLDPDDVFHPGMIQILLNEIRKSGAEIAICGFSEERIPEAADACEAESEGIKSTVIDQKEALKKIADGDIDTAVWNKLYLREIWDDLRFPDGYVFEGAYIVFDLFPKIRKAVLIDQKLIMHRRRSGSICNTYSLKNILDSQYSMDHYISFVERHTPEVFSYNQLRKACRDRIRSIIAAYLKYSCSNPKDTEGRGSIRQKVLEAASGGKIQYCSLSARMIYHTVKAFPNLSAAAYSLYEYLRKR